MDEMKFTQLIEVLGRWKAEIIEGLLKSEGIDVVLIDDSISNSTYANPFAPVQIFVPKESFEPAREILESFEAAEETMDDEEAGTDEEE